MMHPLDVLKSSLCPALFHIFRDASHTLDVVRCFRSPCRSGVLLLAASTSRCRFAGFLNTVDTALAATLHGVLAFLHRRASPLALL